LFFRGGIKLIETVWCSGENKCGPQRGSQRPDIHLKVTKAFEKGQISPSYGVVKLNPACKLSSNLDL
jgi:hypothetical protein